MLQPLPLPMGRQDPIGVPRLPLVPRRSPRRGSCSSGLRGHRAAVSVDAQEMHLSWELLPFAVYKYSSFNLVWVQWDPSGITWEMPRVQNSTKLRAEKWQWDYHSRHPTSPSLPSLETPHQLSGAQLQTPHPLLASDCLQMPQPRCAARGDLLGKTQREWRR